MEAVLLKRMRSVKATISVKATRSLNLRRFEIKACTTDDIVSVAQISRVLFTI